MTALQKPKPIMMINGGSAIAFYDPKYNRIFYNKILDDFPDFKELILEHEEKHRAQPNNYLNHIWIDLKDAFRLRVHKDYMPYSLRSKEVSSNINPPPHNFFHRVMMMGYLFFNFLLSIAIIPLDLYVLLKYKWSKKR